jgi:hypothetical protein
MAPWFDNATQYNGHDHICDLGDHAWSTSGAPHTISDHSIAK